MVFQTVTNSKYVISLCSVFFFQLLDNAWRKMLKNSLAHNLLKYFLITSKDQKQTVRSYTFGMCRKCRFVVTSCHPN